MPKHIWVDADACPKAVKEILYRAAKRTSTPLTLVANQPMSIPSSEFITFIQVGAGFDVADEKIVEKINATDLVVTADIPLASDAIAKGAVALNPRGELYTEETISQRLAMRDVMESLRDTGVHTGGPAPFADKDKQRFAGSLDRWLHQS